MRITEIIHHVCFDQHLPCENIRYSVLQFEQMIGQLLLTRAKDDPYYLTFILLTDTDITLEGTMLVGLDHCWGIQDVMRKLIENIDPTSEDFSKIKSMQLTVH